MALARERRGTGPAFVRPPPRGRRRPDPDQGPAGRDAQPSLSSLSRYERSERDVIVAALAEADGNKSRAAEILGIGRTTMYRKMRSLKIDAGERMTSSG
ncbi:helix-turn-helix domain-containing protein [Arthrobacter sp. C152]